MAQQLITGAGRHLRRAAPSSAPLWPTSLQAPKRYSKTWRPPKPWSASWTALRRWSWRAAALQVGTISAALSKRIVGSLVESHRLNVFMRIVRLCDGFCIPTREVAAGLSTGSPRVVMAEQLEDNQVQGSGVWTTRKRLAVEQSSRTRPPTPSALCSSPNGKAAGTTCTGTS